MSGVRSLEALSNSASTSRVLNLHLVERLAQDDEDYVRKPFFKDNILNRAIYVKHRLRPDETYLIPGSNQPVATKIIFPLDRTDLRTGGQSILVHQTGYKQALCDVLGSKAEELEHDFQILDLLNKLPSLDPFLVREILRRSDISPADCYFSISPSDAARMTQFASDEISDLIRLAFGGGSKKAIDLEQVKKLADALLSTHADQRLEPLRLTLGLQGLQFKEGIFSWKGFIYYKWQFSESAPTLRRISGELEQVKILGRADRTTRNEIADLIGSVRGRIKIAIHTCRTILALYDEAFRDLVDKGNAAAFRKFLLDAPQLFVELGHAMGVVSHIASYWGFKFKVGAPLQAEVSDYLEILSEFDKGLAPKPPPTLVTW